jgi:hypothetical protein
VLTASIKKAMSHFTLLGFLPILGEKYKKVLSSSLFNFLYTTDKTSRPSGQQTCSGFWRPQILISANTPANLTENFSGFIQLLQASAAIIPGHDRFLPHPFQIIVEHVIRRYTV